MRSTTRGVEVVDLCQRCIKDILEGSGSEVFSIDDLADQDDLIEDAIGGTPESVKSVPESECEFWIHERYKRLSAACKKYIDADHELDKLTERVERT